MRRGKQREEAGSEATISSASSSPKGSRARQSSPIALSSPILARRRTQREEEVPDDEGKV